MIVLVLTAIGVASALFSKQRLRRLAQLPLEGLWMVWAAFVSQVVLFEIVGYFIPVTVTNVLHLVTYALCLGFLYRNRRIPGGWIITIGAAANLTAIVANGGTMPANAEAWLRAGLPEPTAFENSSTNTDAHLAFLGDIFYIPASWPLSNVFSIGDILIVIGGTYLAHRWCSTTGSLHTEEIVEASDADLVDAREFTSTGNWNVATVGELSELVRHEFRRVVAINEATRQESENLRDEAVTEVDRIRLVLVQLLNEVEARTAGTAPTAPTAGGPSTERLDAIERQLQQNALAIEQCTNRQNELANAMSELLDTVFAQQQTVSSGR